MSKNGLIILVVVLIVLGGIGAVAAMASIRRAKDEAAKAPAPGPVIDLHVGLPIKRFFMGQPPVPPPAAPPATTTPGTTPTA